MKTIASYSTLDIYKKALRKLFQHIGSVRIMQKIFPIPNRTFIILETKNPSVDVSVLKFVDRRIFRL